MEVVELTKNSLPALPLNRHANVGIAIEVDLLSANKKSGIGCTD